MTVGSEAASLGRKHAFAATTSDPKGHCNFWSLVEKCQIEGGLMLPLSVDVDVLRNNHSLGNGS